MNKEKFRLYLKERRKIKKAAGICINCSRPIDRERSTVYCTICLESIARCVVKFREKHPEYPETYRPRKNKRQTERRKECIAKGICPNCMKEDHAPGVQLCDACRLKAAEYQRRWAEKRKL